MQTVIVVQDIGNEMGQAITRGVIRYIRPRFDCGINKMLLRAPYQNVIDRLKSDPPDGMIAHIAGQQLLGALAECDFPIVNTSNVIADQPFARVCSDDVEAGRMVGRRIMEQGFRQVIYCRLGHVHYAHERCDGLREVVGDRLVAETEVEQTDAWRRQFQKTLRDLPHPVAVVGSDDGVARTVCEAVSETGLSMPVDVAVYGFNNDTMICELSRPTITSVALPFESVGTAAARLLDQLCRGEAPESREQRLPPVEIVARQSTDTTAIEDRGVRQALELIRQTRGKLTVNELIEKVPVSRRGLELAFTEHIGRTPHDYILHVRVENARRLLAETDMTVTQVSASAGFSGPTHMGSVFKRYLGLTPSDVREKLQT